MTQSSSAADLETLLPAQGHVSGSPQTPSSSCSSSPAPVERIHNLSKLECGACEAVVGMLNYLVNTDTVLVSCLANRCPSHRQL